MAMTASHGDADTAATKEQETERERKRRSTSFLIRALSLVAAHPVDVPVAPSNVSAPAPRPRATGQYSPPVSNASPIRPSDQERGGRDDAHTKASVMRISHWLS